MYGEMLLEHFTNPKNVGEMEDADSIGSIRHMVYGDKVTIYIKVREGRIADIMYKAKTGVFGIATGSFITEYVKGKTLEEALMVETREVVDYLGGIPITKFYCADMAITALHHAITKYKEKVSGKS